MKFSRCDKKCRWRILSQKPLVDDIYRVRPNRVCVLMSNYFEISTLDYFFVSAQTQWQNAVWLLRTCWLCGLSCRSAALSFLGSRVLIALRALTFVVCVCCLFNGYRVGHSFGGIQPSVSVSMFDLGTSTNSHPSPQFGCSTAESNIKLTYRFF
jgi:hypothetical protein